MFSSVFEGSQCDLGVYVGPQALESAAAGAVQQSTKNVGQWAIAGTESGDLCGGGEIRGISSAWSKCNNDEESCCWPLTCDGAWDLGH